IGIAMGGKRGSEVSREAADLILMDDNFTTIVNTIRDGRRIYDNIRKAVGYVFTIHIPIAFAALLAPLMKITPQSLLLLPFHVVLLELVIDPTCSIVLERQPAERDIMKKRPRSPAEKLIDANIMAKSIVQGLAVFAASFGVYFAELRSGSAAETARSMGLAVIIFANLFLVQVNSSNTDSFKSSLRRLVRDKVMWAVNIATVSGLAAIFYTPLNGFLSLSPLTGKQALSATALAAASVFWYEIIKLIKRRKSKKILK
ncbi:MAG: cation-translocating P-type ATPase, partial [Oscillospiraceae bacterium]|nr:cation-translocating P-type ATPase [Oscillospiraceae bacterium]